MNEDLFIAKAELAVARIGFINGLQIAYHELFLSIKNWGTIRVLQKNELKTNQKKNYKKHFGMSEEKTGINGRLFL